MARETRLRTRTQEGVIEILALVSHPMETGMRKDKASGRLVPAHFIQEMTLEHKGKVVAQLFCGIGVSENPLMGFRLKDAKAGEKVVFSWKDNLGESGQVEAVVEP
jgi:sulfur-oxidizing protein SoxZ